MKFRAMFILLTIATANANIIPSTCWKTELTGLVGATPAYDNDSIYITNWYGWESWNPGLYKLNAGNGQIEWRNENISGAGKAIIVGNTVIIGDLSGNLFFVNATNGIIERSILLETQPEFWGIASSPVLYNNTIYVQTFSNSTLWALNLNGTLKWKFSANIKGNPYASPFVYDGNILFSARNKIFCLNEGGEELWNFTAESVIKNSPIVADGKIFFSTENYLYALNLNGQLIWKANWNGTISNAITLDSVVCTGGKNGFACFNSTNGEMIWHFKTDKVDSTAAVQNGIIYFATNVPNGTIYAINTDGKLLWFYRLIPPKGKYYNIMSSPIIVGDKLFLGADSGFVYCFNSSGVIELNLTLYPGNYTEIVDGKKYIVTRTSGLGALHFASLGSKSNDVEIGFSYELDDSWYSTYGGLFVSSIMGLKKLWWIYYLNDEMPTAALNQIELKNGDKLYLIYGTGFETPKNATTMIVINVSVKSAGINKIVITDQGFRGGNITALVDVSTVEGWFVLVISGLGNGDSIAGISTFYSKGDLRIPVLILVPQQVRTGIYKLYAGIYRFEEYPEKITTWFGPIEVEVK